MSLKTYEVEIDHGKIVAHQPEQLPETGHGFLTILNQNSVLKNSADSGKKLEALEQLTQNLALDDAKENHWKETIRKARR